MGVLIALKENKQCVNSVSWFHLVGFFCLARVVWKRLSSGNACGKIVCVPTPCGQEKVLFSSYLSHAFILVMIYSGQSTLVIS